MPVHHGAEILYKIATLTGGITPIGAATGTLLTELRTEAAAHGDTLVGTPWTVMYNFTGGAPETYAISMTSSGRFVIADGTGTGLISR